MLGLFRKKNRLEKNDPVFGLIEFQETHGTKMWCHLPQNNEGYMIIIEASEKGPSPFQREFYKTLLHNLHSIEVECKAFITSQKDSPQDFRSMSIYSISIGEKSELDKGNFILELTECDASEIHRVEFQNYKPVGYGIDD